MGSGNGGASCKGVLVPVSDKTDEFKDCVLTPLQSAYLCDESKESFRYTSAALIKNPELEEKYNGFRAKRRELGYSEEDLKETYGFLLFDDVTKAHALGENGVLSGNSTCTTLGDPAKGVYISMYSDCLDPNRWYHGKSGYIAIIRLTKGRIKRVFENYTQNFTTPTDGFDCHVSEQLSSVSFNTSSFLAFERTQYYMYELLDNGSNETAPSPSAACPFAIVSFSYTDNKASVVVPQEKSEEKKTVCHYFSWRGQLQIGSQFYNVSLKSTTRALFLTGKLPPVLKVDRAISKLVLRKLLPRTVFETCFSGEGVTIFLDGLYCSLCELVPSEVEEISSLSLLVQEVKEKGLALPVSLSSGGFLILLHSSHFLTYDGNGSYATKVLQGLFVFPESRLIHRAAKPGDRKVAMSSEILRILPVLTYAEGEVEKTTIDPSEELCEVLSQHMQNYAALINPGLALSPSRDISILPDQYDVPGAHKHLYTTPEWTNGAWQNFRSYLGKPVSFQLPVSKASECLEAGQEDRREDPDDVYICVSSPEEVQARTISMDLEDNLTFQKSPVNIGTSVDSSITSAVAHVDFTDVPQNLPHDGQAEHATKDTEKSDPTVLIRKDVVEKDILNLHTSDDLPAELIVSITSAKQTVTDEHFSVISTVSAAKHNDFEFSGLSTVKLQTKIVNSPNDMTVKMVTRNGTKASNLRKTQRRKLSWRHSRNPEKVSKSVTETPSLQPVQLPVEDNISKIQKDDLAKKSIGHSQLSNPSDVDWRKLPRQKRKFGKLSAKKKKVKSATARQQSNVTREFEIGTMRKKALHWDLKPVASECGRILVPHGSLEFTDQIMYLKDKLSKQHINAKKDTDKMLVMHEYTVEMEQESCTVPETLEDKTEFTTSKDRFNDFQNAAFSDSSLQKTFLMRQADGDYGCLPSTPETMEHSSENHGTETASFEAVHEKQIDNLSLGNGPIMSGFLLTKLKSVLLKGKRKTDVLVSEGMTADTAQDTEPCIKKSKVDSENETLSNNATGNTEQDSVVETSEMLSLDPIFAYALGLTPKEKPDKVQKMDGHGTQLRKDLKATQEESVLDKQPQIIQMPPLIFPKGGRIKTLKKHQGIPAETIKKKWWLHFQTPASFASEKLKNKDCTNGNSFRKTVKEKMNSSCSSTDSLNLLADLALSASNGQVPQQPEPALVKQPETSLKKCDITKDVTSAEQESVLHTLLRQPASRAIAPLESPSPSHLVAGTELVDLISKEHAYSLPQSSSLLLGLPGTPFHISPLCGSTRLLHQPLQSYANGIHTLHPCVYQQGSDEHKQRTPEYLKKHVVHREKFRHSRTFFNKDGSVQITRQWDENYDFSLDSKFTSDSKDRTVIRALHGPWDFSTQDTKEEVRLIVHMWIGLFYSRSTARFFHIDSNVTYPCLDENEKLEKITRMTSAPAQSELKASSSAPFPNEMDISNSSMSKALDLSKKDTSVLGQGALDLSLRNSDAARVSPAPQVVRKNSSVSNKKKEAGEPLNMVKSFMGLQEAKTFQCYKKMAQSIENISKVDDAKNKNGIIPLQRAGRMEYLDVPSLKGYVLFIPQQRELDIVSIKPENDQTPSTLESVLHGSIKEKMDRKGKFESSGSTETSSVEKHAIELSNFVTEKDGEFNKEVDEVVHPMEESESEDEANSVMKERPCKEGNVEPPTGINLSDNFTNNESNVACHEGCLEHKEQFLREQPNSVDPGCTENIDEGLDCRVKKGIEIKDEHGLDEEHSLILSGEAGDNLINKPLLLSCDNCESVKKDSTTDCSHQGPCDEQLSQADSKENGCHNTQPTKLNWNTSALTDEFTILEEASSETESDCEHVREENLERQKCLADNHKAASPTCEENTSSLLEACVAMSVPQTKDGVVPGSQNLDMANITFGQSNAKDIQSVKGEEKDKLTTQQSPHGQVTKSCATEEALTGEIDLKMDRPNEGFKRSNSKVVIPFIGFDISEEDLVKPLDQHPQTKTTFITETLNHCYSDLPIVSASISQMYSEKTDLSGAKIPHYDLSETSQVLDLEGESDDRCSTPTMDEKPLEYTSVPNINTCTNIMQKYPNKISTPVQVKLAHCTTQKVLQCIDKYLSKINQTDKSHQEETAGMNYSLVQINNPSTKDIPSFFSLSHISTDLKGKQISNEISDSVLASASQELHTESSEHHLESPIKSKLEEVLGVRLHLKNTDSSVFQHNFQRTDKLEDKSAGQKYSPSDTCLSYECLQGIKPNMDQVTPRTSQSRFNQRPVMAVKPSKSDDSQGDQMENSPKSKPTKSPIDSCKTATSREKTEHLKGYSEEVNDHMYDSSDFSSKISWLSNVSVSKSNSVSTTFLHYQNNTMVDDKLTLGPENSIVCTVYNTSQERCHSFLDEVSKRCLQDDLTQTSVEQEHLIFYEQIKQLLKRSKRRAISDQDPGDILKSSCPNPVTVQFSHLEEQDDSVSYLEAPLTVIQKFKVDMSDRKGLTDNKEERKTLHLQEAGNQMAHARVSTVTEECARMYEAMMHNVCAVKKVPSRSNFLTIDGFIQETEPRNNFDFCDQMKRKMDESFYSNLNSVVKKSCKTKYRFYILVTSDDAFFQETKAELEAQGHAAIEPPDFFLGENSSSLLIIVRNEDIAEHIFKVPHLLELKKSPVVQFAGVDEPDDVVNLTHQELFTHGGFIMFDRTSLVSLSLWNMKKCSEILQELSRKGKWKWMLHYRDSRRLKENARLSAESKQKMQFLNWCQDTGILEVLPYHDCDLMSKDQPNYLTCLVHLQVQNISARYPVFITDTTMDDSFERNGILTMTIDWFLSNFPGEFLTI